MINKENMLKAAILQCQNAPNKDWQNRGCILVGEPEEHDIANWNKEILGKATCAFFKFEKPMGDNTSFLGFVGDNTSFLGFVLAIAKVGKKTITNATPVINTLKPNDFSHAAYQLSSHFCPECHGIDTVKTRSRRARPECIYITYYCKCGYEDHDVMD